MKIIEMINARIIDSGEPGEGFAYFWKLKGDFYRYIAEVYNPCKRYNEVTTAASDSYAKAVSVKLHAGSFVKLSCVYNQSIFLAEYAQNPSDAIKNCERAISDS